MNKAQAPPLADFFPQEIFSKLPPTDTNAYVTSALLDIRRAVARNDFLTEDAPLTNTSSLPHWLAGSHRLPPWEQTLLFHLFSSPQTVIMVRGGAGCGKTSTIGFLQHYIQIAAASTRRWQNSAAFGQPLLVLDLQGLAEDLKSRKEGTVAQEQQAQRVVGEIATALDAILDTHLSTQALGEVFGRAFLRQPSKVGTFGELEIIAQTIRSIFRKNYGDALLKDGAGDGLSAESIRDILASIPNAHHQLGARLLILAEVAKDVHERDGCGVTLVIDNIDPFPDYVQHTVLRSFQALAFNRPLPGLHIAVFVRLSTDAIQSGALEGMQESVNFQGPDPATIIFYRTTVFLLRPESSFRYQKLKPEQQRIVYQRVLLLWRHLTDQTSDFTRVLSGLAGTNIRNALQISRDWCLSPRLVNGRGQDTVDYRRLLQMATGGALLASLAETLARACALVFEPEEIRRVLSDLSPRRAGRALANQLSSIFVQVLIDHRLFDAKDESTPFPATTNCRGVFSLAAKSALQEMFSQSLYAESRTQASWLIRSGVADAISGYPPYRSSSERNLALSIAASFSLSLPVACREHLSVGREEQETILEPLLRWIVDAFHEGVRAAPTKRSMLYERENWEVRLLRELDHAVGNTGEEKTNRHFATSILISPESESRVTEKSTINVFSANGSTLAPAALWTLSFLQESRTGERVTRLLEHLNRYGFEEADVRVALTDMVHVRRRLIFSGVKDYHEGVDSWLGDPARMVYISAAGTAFLRQVVTAPAYLQWSLLQPRPITDRLARSGLSLHNLRSLTGRLRVVLCGLEAAAEDDLERTHAASSSLRRSGFNSPPSARAACPSASVFFDALPKFMASVIVHGRKQTSLANRTDAEQLVQAFLEAGANLINRNRLTLKDEVKGWEEEWAFCEHDAKVRMDYSYPGPWPQANERRMSGDGLRSPQR